MKAKKTQLKDIAKEAGVSIALVSYVINGQHKNRIKKETADKIMDAVKKLDYRPNKIAQRFRSQTSGTIGLILADLSNSFSAKIARVIEDEVAKLGYMVLIGSMDESTTKLRELVDTFLDRQVDGFIIIPAEDSILEIERLEKMQTPYVLMDRYFSTDQLNYVINDNYTSAHLLTSTLIKRGKKNIAFITHSNNYTHFKERKRGFLEACQNSSASVNIAIREVGLADLKVNINDALDKLLSDQPATDGIVFSTNMLTLYGLSYMLQNQISVPESIDIMGYDEEEFYDFFPHNFTYYRQPLDLMGKRAVAFLIEKISTKNSNSIHEVILGKLVN